MRLSKEKREELKALAEKDCAKTLDYLAWEGYGLASRKALPDALADIEELESKLADAVKALEKYGKHPDSCPKGVGIGYYKPPDDAKCNCGIDASITVKP